MTKKYMQSARDVNGFSGLTDGSFLFSSIKPGTGIMACCYSSPEKVKCSDKDLKPKTNVMILNRIELYFSSVPRRTTTFVVPGPN